MWEVLDDMTIHKTDSDNTRNTNNFYELTQPSKMVERNKTGPKFINEIESKIYETLFQFQM